MLLTCYLYQVHCLTVVQVTQKEATSLILCVLRHESHLILKIIFLLCRGYMNDFLLAMVTWFFLNCCVASVCWNCMCSHPHKGWCNSWKSQKKITRNSMRSTFCGILQECHITCARVGTHVWLWFSATRHFQKIALSSQAKDQSCSRSFTI